MSVRLPVVRARWSDTGRLVDLVTATLSPTSLGAWLVPDERRRSIVLAAAARIWIEHALLVGDAFLLRDGTAATVWFHRYRPIPAPTRYADRLGQACGEYATRFLLLDQRLSAQRPVEAHNHLAMLAAPGPHGARRAAAVLAGAQRWMDTLGLPTYAEAFTEADRELYRRHGYADGEAFRVPGGTTTHPMWRVSPLWTARAGGNAHWSTHYTSGRARNSWSAALRQV
ncbi:hypothetical protein Q2K19_28590 [Micromonospora soli]|uniref:hypothetical protein n=1 Tax=Micromonospora sp. NBRC 110009 TaxID=3061627 RepID=UPI002671FFE2|nr:hypothetical protein [Micromonospora sp. NBRC 110009]WKT98084.1 hypothetical protein Q2K19_28590 [Micromonospora sp. NBRC 110009]